MNAISMFTHKEQGSQISLFKIRIRNGFVYMKMDNHFLGGKQVGGPEKIIIVDSNQFLELWKNDPGVRKNNLPMAMNPYGVKTINFIMRKKDFPLVLVILYPWPMFIVIFRMFVKVLLKKLLVLSLATRIG